MMVVRLMMAAVFAGATVASAQQTPPPPPRRPMPDTLVRPAAPAPRAEPALPVMPALPPTGDLPLMPVMPPMPDFPDIGQGFGSVGGGFGLRGDLDALRFELQDRVEMQRDFLRDEAVWQAREQALRAEELAQGIRSGQWGEGFGGAIGWGGFGTTPRAAWAPGDPADSLYRQARELLNRGEYRRAANAFAELPQKFPNSAYAADALYWQAFALFRVGGTNDLRQALAALETQRTKYPNARTRNSDAPALTMRIQGALAARGDAAASAALARAGQDSALSCDREQQAVASQALAALSRIDADNMSTLMKSVLARKDACSVPLRKNAVLLLASNRGDANASGVLMDVIRNDPSVEVRAYALGWLGRMPGDAGLSLLSELVRAPNEDEQIKRAAIRALVAQSSPQARQLVRSVVENDGVSDRLRAEALSAFDRDHATADDVTWLRALYAKVQNRTLKQRALSAIVRIGGDDVNQWLLSIVRNPDESSDLRTTALRRVGETLPIADLSRLYDDAADRMVREQVISVLQDRKEPEATDKLIDIVKTGTDPNLRTRAISALTSKSKDDPRTLKLLLDIVSK